MIGHREGGIIAPIVAGSSKDIAFIVLLAGTGIPGDQLLLLQQELIGKASGISDVDVQKNKAINKGAFEIIRKSTNTEKLKIDLTQYLKQNLKDTVNNREDLVKSQVSQMTSPWMLNFLKYNPAPTLEKVKCPVLALNGEKDLQVPAKINLAAIKNALLKGGNNKLTTKELPNLNHLFQECKTGAPSEYASIEQTFSPTALTEILKWLQLQTK